MHTRRQLLIGTGMLSLCSRLGAAQAGGPMRARVELVTTDYFGQKISDPYRWMENPKDPDWAPWLKSQADHADAALAALPDHASQTAAIARYSAQIDMPGFIFPAGDQLFIVRRPKGAKAYRTYARPMTGGPERLVFDPEAAADQSGRAFTASEGVPSPDGRFYAVNLVPDGNEDEAAIRVYEVATGKQVGDPAPGARFGRISWLPDSSGFFYNRLSGRTPRGDVHFYDDPVCVLHRIDGTTPARVMLENRTLPSAPDNPQYIPYLIATAGSDWVVAAFVLNIPYDGPLYLARLADLIAGRPAWRQIAVTEDNVQNIAVCGDTLYLMSNAGAPHFEVRQASAANPAYRDARVVVPQSDVILAEISASSEGVWVRGMKAGQGHLQFVDAAGLHHTVDLPKDGSLWGVQTHPLRTDAWLGFDDYTTFGGFYRMVRFGAAAQPLSVVEPFPFSLDGYHVERVMVPARDGAKVPVDLVKRRDLKRDGSNPVLIQGYGAYGKSMEPIFTPQYLAFLDAGGIFVVAHVRGGGELGEEWHLAGQKATKPNTWRDAIDCGEWLIASGWSGTGRLALWGTSAGGIMVGRAITERPDLFAAAVDRVGLCDALRFELSQNGPSNINEFGTVKKPDEFRWLLAMSPYHAVRDGTRYPAVLLMTGANDPRVDPWQLGKFTARLQAASISGKPVLLRVNYAAGHGGGASIESGNRELADMFAFVLAHTRLERPA